MQENEVETGNITKESVKIQKGKNLLHKRVKMSLNDYLHIRNIFVRENNIETDALFLSNERKRISKEVLTNLFKRYSDGTINPHMLRHLVGTKLYHKTNNIMIVQKQLRHSSLETAAKYYVHIDEKEIADAIAML